MDSTLHLHLKLLEYEEILNEGRIYDEIATKTHNLINRFKLNLKLFKNWLTKKNVDVDEIKNDAKRTSRKLQMLVKNRTEKEKVTKFLTKQTTHVVNKHMHKIRDDFATAYKQEGLRAVFLSVVILICVIFLNDLFELVTLIFLGPILSGVLEPIVGAPLIEEYAKRLAVLGGFPYMYTTIFGTTEFLQYIFYLKREGNKMAKVLFLRLCGLIVHYATTVIQKYYHKKSIVYSKEDRYSKIDMYEKGKSFQGYWIGVMLHSMYNIFAVVFDNAIARWTKI